MLTTQQVHHALGLTLGRTATGAVNGTPDWYDLRAIVNAGLAYRIPWGWSGGDLFYLNRAGAEAALRPGETLDPEDFP